MKKHKVDTEMPVGILKRAKDTLPSPEELMAAERTVKVTLRLSEASLMFFKEYARKYHVKYQKLIRKLVDNYASHYSLSKS